MPNAYVRWLEKYDIFILMAFVYIIVIVIFSVPEILGLFKEYSILILGTLILIASWIISRRIQRSMTLNKIRLEEYNHMKLGETHPLLYRRISKFVKIKSQRGDATIDYHMECKNTSDHNISQIKHEVHHDNDFRSIRTYLNDKDAKVEYHKFIMQEIDGKEPPFETQRILRLKFDLSDERVEPKQDFTYGYIIDFDRVFSKMFESEHTSRHVMHPTAILLFSLELPEGLKFDSEGTNIRVTDKHDLEDEKEQKRCKNFPPKILSGGKILIWEVLEPKIACTYRLDFKVKRGA